MIKVDRELPEIPFSAMQAWVGDRKEFQRGKAYLKAQGDMVKDGYVAVEPLILDQQLPAR